MCIRDRQFVGLVGTGAGAAGHDGPAHGTTFEQHFGFNGWVAAGIENLAGHDGVDDEVERIDHVGRGINLAILWVAPCSRIVTVGTRPECLNVHVRKPRPMRMLHTMLRVGDLDRSIAFYTDVLGMQLLRRKEYPSGRFTLAFLGYGPESEQTVLELTHNWDTSSYELGDAYGHIALGVEDIRSTCAAISGKGGRVVREPGPMKHGSTVIAFVEDPDGYKVELIEMSSRAAA